MIPVSLIAPERYLGSITQVTASTVTVNMPFAAVNPERRSISRGVVGEFVFVDCETVKLLGRIIEIRIPDNERLSIEPALGKEHVTNPVGRVQLLASIDSFSQKIVRGLRVYPRIGDSVYVANSVTLGELFSNAMHSVTDLTILIGNLDAGSTAAIRLRPEQMFGRHCGIFGATGGGKSWTVASIISEIKSSGGKAILFDPTGEFSNNSDISKHYAFDYGEPEAIRVHFPYRNATEDDLFAIFRPAGLSQGPKLREAIRSLKLVEAIGENSHTLNIFEDRIISKKNFPRKAFYEEASNYKAALHNPLCRFNIMDLPEQLLAECVHSVGRPNASQFGDLDQQAQSYCESLVARIRVLLHSSELNCLFGGDGLSLTNILDDFVDNQEDDVIRISFKGVRFEHHTREILMNIIGRYLLGRARDDIYRDKPLITILDEAHQFMGRSIGDEYASVRLESFGLIAKEGRKYGLTCVLATQRPRDIPADVLSQLGTFIVHRLTNEEDRQAIEKACGDLDRNAALFIPSLAPGEAIIIGPGLPVPVPVKISQPASAPNSSGPNYSKYWEERLAAKEVEC